MENVANILLGSGAFVLPFLWVYAMSAPKREDFVSSFFAEIGFVCFAFLALGGVMHGVAWLMQHVQFV